jgi:predicted HTH transcriptional regulator
MPHRSNPSQVQPFSVRELFERFPTEESCLEHLMELRYGLRHPCEAVVNAVVHRSYNLKNMNIFIKMFNDKFVVESPGAFLPPTTAETVFDAHNPRNPNTMWALYYFDFVQCAFEGTRRMRGSCPSRWWKLGWSLRWPLVRRPGSEVCLARHRARAV